MAYGVSSNSLLCNLGHGRDRRLSESCGSACHALARDSIHQEHLVAAGTLLVTCGQLLLKSTPMRVACDIVFDGDHVSLAT